VIAIDVETSDYEKADNSLTAADRLQARHPEECAHRLSTLRRASRLEVMPL
jgi:hypothetical protein